MQAQILGFITPLIAVVIGITFAIMWRVGGMRRHVLGYAIAYASFAIGFLITHLLPASSLFLFHATQFFYSFGAIVLLASVCERVGQKLHIKSMIAVYLISAAVLTLAVSISDEADPRLLIVNIGYGVMFAMGVTTLLNARRREALDIALIIVLTIQAADFLIRPTLTLMFERSIDVAVYRDSIYYSLIGLVLAVKSISTAMVLIGATIAEWADLLRERGNRDDLTGLSSRGVFEIETRAMLPRAHAEGASLSLIVADIDLFKQVNDIWGHQAGDAAIVSFANLIASRVRGHDVTGRIGGEEFCIAVWNCDNRAAENLAERIRMAFGSQEHTALGEGIRLTASFGVATAREGEGYAQLFARADEALYRAKASGRNRVENAERQMACGEPEQHGHADDVREGAVHVAAG
ncbi:GGDEF domain-containing protein [Erythrobacter rubeus]|uniref:diguanylate cyclase n=1 Tax=Erythrobacter rubeus TaxID=2760803 RepID=A0ABR8KVT5_9SPHN|nr:GGDEF domain-containing protein [Erythrobacter rubeus]MBD2842251.1 GGDEF domain-containing protein [Erythrobacter rubeus]